MQQNDQFIAAAIGDIEWLRQSLRKGRINYDKDGMSALHQAAKNAQLYCMKFLIEEYKFEVDLISPTNGCTPLLLATNRESEKYSLECVQYLLDKGANPCLSNNEGTTALHQAANHGHLVTLVLLIDSGADVNSKDQYGNLPLDLAQLGGHEKCGRLLRATMWHKDKEYIAKQMKILYKVKHQLHKTRSVDDDSHHKEKKIKAKTRGSPKKVSSAPKFVYRQKTLTDHEPTSSEERCPLVPRPKSSKPDIWKPFSHAYKTEYIPNLEDKYPRDPYTLMPKSPVENKYFDGKHKGFEKVLLTKDNYHDLLPDLPEDVLTKELSLDPTMHDRPLVFKPKSILDIPEKYKPKNVPKTEVYLHLSLDTNSIIFQNSLQPRTKMLLQQPKEPTCTCEY